MGGMAEGGRSTASQMTSASVVSFLLVLTYGLTNCWATTAHRVAHRLELAMLVDSVDLDHVPRQVDANSRKLHSRRPFRERRFVVTLYTLHQQACVSGAACLRGARCPELYLEEVELLGTSKLGDSYPIFFAAMTPGERTWSNVNPSTPIGTSKDPNPVSR